MITCPNGHPNPKGQQLCEECDALIVPAMSQSSPWYRRWWFTAAAMVVVAVVSATVAVAVVKHGESARTQPPSNSAAIQQWWTAGTDEHVKKLHDALDGARTSVQRFDKSGLEKSCQRIHDSAVVDLQAHLPSPDPDLTAELTAAIDDAHTMSHMCLSVMAGSPNNYDSEFNAYLDQAEQHLEAATDIVKKSRLEA